MDLIPPINCRDGSVIPVVVFSAHQAPSAGPGEVVAVLLKSQASNEELLAVIKN